MKCKIRLKIDQIEYNLDMIRELESRGLLVNGEINCEESRDHEVKEILNRYHLNH